MPINWDKVPEGTLKWELHALEVQLLAIQEKGALISDVAIIAVRIQEVAEHVNMMIDNLSKMCQFSTIELYVENWKELAALADNVVSAARINTLRDHREHFEGKDKPVLN